MKNIHLLPTDKPSRLHKYNFEGFALSKEALNWKEAYNISITSSNEEIKEGDWFLDDNNQISHSYRLSHVKFANPKKIILTTDQDLIKDGVQEIDNEFLEWFIKNPSCESVEVENERIVIDDINYNFDVVDYKYKIIIPKEEPKQDLPTVNGSYGCTIQTKKKEHKQETLEEAIDRISKENGYDIEGGKVADFVDGMVKGAKWQQERSYSEEDMREAIMFGANGMYGWQMGEEGYTDNQIKRFLKTFKKEIK